MSKWTKRQIESASMVAGAEHGDLRGDDLRRAAAAMSNGLLDLDMRGGPNAQNMTRNGRVAGRLVWSHAARAAECHL